MEPEIVRLVEVIVREGASAPRLLTMPPLCDLALRHRQYLKGLDPLPANLGEHPGSDEELAHRSARHLAAALVR